MAATTAALASGGMTNCCLRCGLRRFFFSVRPIVLSLALATMFSSTTLSSSRLNVHRARPFGGSEQARAINLASEAPSKMRVLAEAGECLRVSTASNPSSTSCWRVRAIVARLVFKALAIWLSLQASPASPASAFNRMRAFVNLWAGCLPLRIRLSSRSRSSALSFTTYFFTAISLAATNRLRQYVTEPSIRTFYSLSTTGGTSLGDQRPLQLGTALSTWSENVPWTNPLRRPARSFGNRCRPGVSGRSGEAPITHPLTALPARPCGCAMSRASSRQGAVNDPSPPTHARRDADPESLAANTALISGTHILVRPLLRQVSRSIGTRRSPHLSALSGSGEAAFSQFNH